MQINASLGALANLLALIQESNPKFSVVTEAGLSVASVASQDADAAGRNAAVVVTAAGYDGQASFTYIRRGLTDNVINAATALSVDPSTMKASDVHAAIAGALALVQDEVQISSASFNADGSITGTTDGSAGVLTVQANPSSLLYIDTPVTIALNFPAPPPPVVPTLASLVDVAALNGFAAAQAPTAPVAPADGTSAATDGTAPAAPAAPADGTSTAPAADGTSAATTTTAATDGTAPVAPTAPAAPAADGQAAAATDGTAAAAPAAATDGQAAAPAATN